MRWKSGLSFAIARKPSQLSGGQRQRSPSPGRWSMSRASCCWMSRLGALDLKLREQMQFELKEASAGTGHHLYFRHPRSGRSAVDVGPGGGVQ
jgi:putative spermidine/putrescine transport system ATP-binding protein